MVLQHGVDVVVVGVVVLLPGGANSWVAPVLGVGFPLCLGELLALPGLTGRTGKGPQVFGAGEKEPPNWGMGRRGCRIWCIV